MALAVEVPPVRPVEMSPSEEAIADVIEAVRAGDREQFETLVEWHRDKVYRMAWRVAQDQDSALDIVQEVFVRVYKGLKGWRGQSKFSTWLHRIVMNTAIDVMRQESRHRKHQTPLLDEHLALIPDTRSGSDPRQVAARNQLRARVFEAVTRLSAKQRACFTLRHQQQLSLNEIAETLGCSEGAVKKHLARAIARLRQLLGES
jgi:RNA polymerase sigma-70 factor (ECF subfamily)